LPPRVRYRPSASRRRSPIAIAVRHHQNKKAHQARHATYSYCISKRKSAHRNLIEKTAALGVEGLDILHRQMTCPKWSRYSRPPSYLRKLKRHASATASRPSAFHPSNFVQQDPAQRQKHIEHTHKCFEIAYELGIPASASILAVGTPSKISTTS